MSRIKRVNVRYGQIVFDLDDIDRIMEECWKIVRAAKKAELIYEKDKEAAEKQFRTEAAKHFEKAFGKGSCWKVFGTHWKSFPKRKESLLTCITSFKPLTME